MRLASCKKHLVCPLCAIRRAAKQVKAYPDRLTVIQSEQEGLQASLVTFTVKNGEDLSERYRHLTGAFRRMQHARRNFLADRGPFVELAKIEGAVGSYEFKRGKNSGLWHPHIHMVVLHPHTLDQARLREDWKRFTGDSFMVDVTPFHDQEDPVSGFRSLQVRVKFSDLPLADNWTAFQELAGKRLVFFVWSVLGRASPGRAD